jgi:hypothetical protein
MAGMLARQAVDVAHTRARAYDHIRSPFSVMTANVNDMPKAGRNLRRMRTTSPRSLTTRNADR